MSYSNSFPTQRPTLNLVFNGGSDQLDSRLSYSRSSTGTYLSNEKALSSENLLLQSQDFDTTWVNDGSVGIASVTGGQTAPDGTSTAWLVTADTFTAQYSRIQQSITINTGTTYTMVAHVKAGTASHAYISFRGASTQSCSVTLNFSTQALTNTAFNFTNVSSSVTALSNSWFKLTLTGTTDNSTASPNARIGISDGSAVTANGLAQWDSTGETIYAWGAQLSTTNSKVYDSPTTTQVSREYSPLLKTAAANEPRFEYASDGQSEGLLIESQVSNLVTYSEDFSNAFYGKDKLTVDSDVAVAPDGTLTASALRVDGTAASAHRIFLNYATGGATPQTFSIFAKAGSLSWLALNFKGTGVFTSSSAYFNLSDGTTGTVASGLTAKISDCGNGWYRCSITLTALSSGTGAAQVYLASANDDVTIDGNSYDHILCWGAQVEANTSAPSSYIKSNSGSSTTKSADSCSVATSSFYTGGDVSIFAEVTDAKGDYATVARLRNTTTGDGLFLYKANANSASTANLDYRSYDGGLKTNFSITGSGGATKVAVVAETNRFAGVADGGTVAENLSASVPAGLDTLNIGGQNTQYVLNGTVKRVALYNVALSDTELQAITS